MAADRPITVPRFRDAKSDGRRLAVLTAYDYTMATLLDAAGVDALLVGDSLGMVVQGRANTVPVTLEQMIYHGEMVARAAKHALVIVDMPFGTCTSIDRTVENGVRLLQATGAAAVKIEGGAQRADHIAALVAADVPVMGHCGLLPQGVHGMGGYRIQRDVERLIADVQAVEAAGAFGLVLECVTPEAAAAATNAVQIPTIGIGAGAACDGQVLVINDVLSLTVGYQPKFAKQYADLREVISNAAEAYCREVRERVFPEE